MDDEDGLLNIEISDDEADKNEDKAARRTEQTEADFQAVKRGYHAKVENGNVHAGITLPLPPGANKQHIQEVLHAVEELYFFRRYQEAVDFIVKVLHGASQALDENTKNLLGVYMSRCRERMCTPP
ncbi:hypothetical protein S40285_03579 [Stachybotrys chlorohalonatus IBT 40285]|uniref:Uncharacterized protein n=1 Tax=Stachybotrys chlorohalonatus (strain IBT 40285) TaxID=1283841 RepID=A0A084QBS2_STAC4|nr:hypothetical protein S40285_03579 [Stachybotrys chlorohalonata IBT 40285]